MYFNRFDIVEAYYLALSHCHTGQSSKEYKRLSQITEYFNPSFNLSYETLSDNGKIIYQNVIDKLIKE